MLSSFQAHVQNVCAIKGSAISQEQLKLLSRSVKRILFALDNDSAGIEATKRAIALAHEYDISLRVILLTGGKDPDDIAREDPAKWREFVKKSVTVYDYLIDQSFTSHDVHSGDGKREITNELGPMVMGITNAVEQSHYLQKIAKRLDVSEDIVFMQFKKKALPQMPTTEKRQEPEKSRERSEILEEYLLSLLFHMDGEAFVAHIERAREATTSPLLERVLEYVTHPRGYNLAQFSASLPEELKSLFFSLYMRDDEELGKLELSSEFSATEKELAKQRQKKNREELAVRITELEEKQELTDAEFKELKMLQARMMKR